MARCEDCIHNKVCLHKANIQTDTYEYMGVSYDTEKCEHYKPTADVVPKSEVEKLQVEILALKQKRVNLYERIELVNHTSKRVAREIFEEIENLMDKKFIITHGVVLVSKENFAELKKKYQEGEPNGENIKE